jgi:hypothetical protein
VIGNWKPKNKKKAIEMDDQHFPYDFDLWFDIKSREDLVRTYANLKQELASMDRIMSAHGMEFTQDELALISPEPEQPEPSVGPKLF